MENMNEYIDCIPNDFWVMSLEECHNKNYLDAYSILARGFWYCKNKPKERKLLLTGINPSYDGTHYGKDWIKTTQFADLARLDKKNGFWKKKEQQFGGLWNDDTMSYLDLFPIRESAQSHFEKSFDKDEDLRALRGKILEVTQDTIEAMAPRLIVHANRQSMYYWGVKPAQEADVDANDYEHPWMGYKVKRVVKDISKFNSKEHLVEIKKLPDCMTEERLKKFPLYMIIGYIDNSERINYKRKSTSLEGCFLMEYVMEYRKKEDRDKMYKYTEWVKIWKWVKEQSPAD